MGPAVLDDQGNALARVGRIERHICASGLEDRQQGDHHGLRAIHENADESLRFDTEVLKTLRQGIDPFLELTICEFHVAEDKRGRFRTARICSSSSREIVRCSSSDGFSSESDKREILAPQIVERIGQERSTSPVRRGGRGWSASNRQQ